MGFLRKFLTRFSSNKSGSSYTISTVIITATLAALLVVAYAFAYQVLEREKGAAEFGIMKQSFLAINDAIEYVAWKPGATLPSKFIVMYGQLEVIPGLGAEGNGPENEFELEVKIKTIEDDENDNGTIFNFKNKLNGTGSDSTGSLRYSVSNKYVNFAEGYSQYLLGNENLIVMSAGGLMLMGTGNGFTGNSYGRLLMEQKFGWVSLTLNYAIRLQITSLVASDGQAVTYIDVNMIRLTIDDTKIGQLIGEFQLNARCLDVKTISSGAVTLTDANGDGSADQMVEVEAELESEIGGVESEIEQEIELYFTDQGIRAKIELESEIGGNETETEQEIMLSQLPMINGSGQLIVTVTTSQVQISVQQK